MSERRELLLADLDAIDPSRLLWRSDSDGDCDSDDSDSLVRRATLVRDALACLTDKQRQVVHAYFFEGRSQSAIARELGVSQQVVHKRIFGVVRDGQRVGGALKRLATHLAPLMHAQ